MAHQTLVGYPRDHHQSGYRVGNASRSERGTVAWVPLLWYSYKVNGIEYHGQVTAEPWYLDVRSALAAADDLIGKNIQIRYRPDTPAKSTWLQDDRGSGQLAAPAKPDAVSGLIVLSLK